LPAWGSPAVAGDRLLFGLGNGRLLTSVQPPEKPAGALLCVDAKTGETLYQFAVSDGVLARALVDDKRVYFTARDGFCYALDLATGRAVWRAPLGGPAVTTPALAGDHLYVLPVEGPALCLDALTGERISSFDLRKWNGTDIRLLSSPVVAPSLEPSAAEIVYVGAEVRGPLGSAAVLYALRRPR
jgi:outer membrane protein assembly factor BamB